MPKPVLSSAFPRTCWLKTASRRYCGFSRRAVHPTRSRRNPVAISAFIEGYLGGILQISGRFDLPKSSSRTLSTVSAISGGSLQVRKETLTALPPTLSCPSQETLTGGTRLSSKSADHPLRTLAPLIAWRPFSAIPDLGIPRETGHHLQVDEWDPDRPLGLLTLGICHDICQSALMSAFRHIKLFKNGRNQAVRIPREFELPGEDAIIRREGDKLIIEAAPPKSLLALLSKMTALEDTFPEVDDAPPSPVSF